MFTDSFIPFSSFPGFLSQKVQLSLDNLPDTPKVNGKEECEKKEPFLPTFSKKDEILTKLYTSQICDEFGSPLKEERGNECFSLNSTEDEKTIKAIYTYLSKARQITFEFPESVSPFQSSVHPLSLLERLAFSFNIKRVEFIGRTVVEVLSRSGSIEDNFFYQASLKSESFNILGEEKSELIKEWFNDPTIQRQFKLKGTDEDFRSFLDEASDEDLQHLIKATFHLLTSGDNFFPVSSYKTHLSEHSNYKSRHLISTNRISYRENKGLCLQEFGGISKLDSIFNGSDFNKSNRYTIIGLKSEKDIDLLFVNSLKNTTLFCNTSLTIPMNSLFNWNQETSIKLKLDCGPFSDQKYLCDLLCGICYVHDRKTLTEFHWLKFLTFNTIQGNRFTQIDLEKELIDKVLENKKAYLEQKQITKTASQSLKKSISDSKISHGVYLYHLILDYLKKHHLNQPHFTIAFLFNACRSLKSHSSISDEDLAFIWEEMEKEKILPSSTLEDPPSLFLMELKNFITQKKQPFTELMAIVQTLTFIFFPASLTKHDGHPAFGLDIPCQDDVFSLFMFVEPEKGFHLLSRSLKDQPSKALHSILALYQALVHPSKTKPLYPNPLRTHLEHLNIDSKRLVDLAYLWIDHFHPFTNYLGFYFYLAIPEIEISQHFLSKLCIQMTKIASFEPLKDYFPSFLLGISERLAEHKINPMSQALKEFHRSSKVSCDQAWIEVLLSIRYPLLTEWAYHLFNTLSISKVDKKFALKVFDAVRHVNPPYALTILDSLHSLSSNKRMNTLQEVISFILICQAYQSRPSYPADLSILIKIGSRLLETVGSNENELKDILDKKNQKEAFSKALTYLIQALFQSSYVCIGNDFLFQTIQKNYLRLEDREEILTQVLQNQNHPLIREILSSLLKEDLIAHFQPSFIQLMIDYIHQELDKKNLSLFLLNLFQNTLKNVSPPQQTSLLAPIEKFLTLITDNLFISHLKEDIIKAIDRFLLTPQLAHLLESNKGHLIQLINSYLMKTGEQSVAFRFPQGWNLIRYSLEPSSSIPPIDGVKLLIHVLKQAKGNNLEAPPFIMDWFAKSGLKIIESLAKCSETTHSELKDLTDFLLLISTSTLAISEKPKHHHYFLVSQGLLKTSLQEDLSSILSLIKPIPRSFFEKNNPKERIPFLHRLLETLIHSSSLNLYINDTYDWMILFQEISIQHPSYEQKINELLLHFSSHLIQFKEFLKAAQLLLLISDQTNEQIRQNWLDVLSALKEQKHAGLAEDFLLKQTFRKAFQNDSALLLNFIQSEILHLIQLDQLSSNRAEQAIQLLEEYKVNDGKLWTTVWQRLISLQTKKAVHIKEHTWTLFKHQAVDLMTLSPSSWAECWAAIFKNLEQIQHPDLVSFLKNKEFLNQLFSNSSAKSMFKFKIHAYKSLLCGTASLLSAEKFDLDLLMDLKNEQHKLNSDYERLLKTNPLLEEERTELHSLSTTLSLNLLKQLSGCPNSKCFFILLNEAQERVKAKMIDKEFMNYLKNLVFTYVNHIEPALVGTNKTLNVDGPDTLPSQESLFALLNTILENGIEEGFDSLNKIALIFSKKLTINYIQQSLHMYFRLMLCSAVLPSKKREFELAFIPDMTKALDDKKDFFNPFKYQTLNLHEHLITLNPNFCSRSPSEQNKLAYFYLHIDFRLNFNLFEEKENQVKKTETDPLKMQQVWAELDKLIDQMINAYLVCIPYLSTDPIETYIQLMINFISFYGIIDKPLHDQEKFKRYFIGLMKAKSESKDKKSEQAYFSQVFQILTKEKHCKDLFLDSLYEFIMEFLSSLKTENEAKDQDEKIFSLLDYFIYACPLSNKHQTRASALFNKVQEKGCSNERKHSSMTEYALYLIDNNLLVKSSMVQNTLYLSKNQSIQLSSLTPIFKLLDKLLEKQSIQIASLKQVFKPLDKLLESKTIDNLYKATVDNLYKIIVLVKLIPLNKLPSYHDKILTQINEYFEYFEDFKTSQMLLIFLSQIISPTKDFKNKDPLESKIIAKFSKDQAMFGFRLFFHHLDSKKDANYFELLNYYADLLFQILENQYHSFKTPYQEHAELINPLMPDIKSLICQKLQAIQEKETLKSISNDLAIKLARLICVPCSSPFDQFLQLKLLIKWINFLQMENSKIYPSTYFIYVQKQLITLLKEAFKTTLFVPFTEENQKLIRKNPEFSLKDIEFIEKKHDVILNALEKWINPEADLSSLYYSNLLKISYIQIKFLKDPSFNLFEDLKQILLSLADYPDFFVKNNWELSSHLCLAILNKESLNSEKKEQQCEAFYLLLEIFVSSMNHCFYGELSNSNAENTETCFLDLEANSTNPKTVIIKEAKLHLASLITKGFEEDFSYSFHSPKSNRFISFTDWMKKPPTASFIEPILELFDLQFNVKPENFSKEHLDKVESLLIPLNVGLFANQDITPSSSLTSLLFKISLKMKDKTKIAEILINWLETIQASQYAFSSHLELKSHCQEIFEKAQQATIFHTDTLKMKQLLEKAQAIVGKFI